MVSTSVLLFKRGSSLIYYSPWQESQGLIGLFIPLYDGFPASAFNTQSDYKHILQHLTGSAMVKCQAGLLEKKGGGRQVMDIILG